MNAPQIAVEHNGIKITYNEDRNEWEFTLRDRDRTAETLAKARECIDRPVKDKKTVFQRIECWIKRGHVYGDFEKDGHKLVVAVSLHGVAIAELKEGQ